MNLKNLQKSLCRKYDAQFCPSLLRQKLGISKNVLSNAMPLNGLRHPPEGDTCGWYIWAGEQFSDADDFFEPLHVEHVDKWCPVVTQYLGLAPGWRFLIDPSKEYVDVWFDENLLLGGFNKGAQGQV
jgi:hypothetical protein